MSYLIFQDFKKLIQVENLNQIIGNDTAIIEQFELASIQEMKSYLVQKYDVDAEFTNTPLWVKGTVYKAKNRVYIDATAFSASTTYSAKSLVLYLGNVYYNTSTVTAGAWNASNWTLIGKQYQLFYAFNPKPDWDYYTDYEAGANVFYKDKTYTCLIANTSYAPNENANYWGAGTAYSIAGTVDIWDTNYWTLGDNRNQQLVNYLIDIVLYHILSRIAPMNIPDLRVKRYDNAIYWLKQCATGEFITSGLQVIQPKQGQRIRTGSRLPKQNNNF
jgi:hypothetical protein